MTASPAPLDKAHHASAGPGFSAAPFTLQRGRTPLLISMPHCGTALPAELAQRMHPRATAVEDTDWHLAELYAFAEGLGASLLKPHYSRYVIDLNRPPDDQPMYAGANNTELCPTRFFTGEVLYAPGQAPDAREIDARRNAVWMPYHAALRAELDRLRALHGHAVLLDAHSIKSQLPWLFDGELPHLNLGTADGRACDPSLRKALRRVLDAHQGRWSSVVDGRFKGGHITRHYGAPAQGIHAVQLEKSWRFYLDERRPAEYDAGRAAPAQDFLRDWVQTLIDWRPPQG